VRARGLRRLTAELPDENSLAAFEYALAHGCDGFEFDVRHALDGRNVLWHNPDCNGLAIADANLPELSERHGSLLPCLEDVLRQFGSRAYLDVELKVAGGEESVVAALRASPPQKGFTVSSFLPEVILRLHDLASDLPLGFICDSVEAMPLWRELPINVFLPRYRLVQPVLIADAHRRGLKVMSWTVNHASRTRKLAEWGIDGLISDDPAGLYQMFHSQ
jgi:glycerophosphoryl diester phosphodiesterase